MKTMKRILAFISTFAFTISYNTPNYVAIAEDTVDLKDNVSLQSEDVSALTTEDDSLNLNVIIPDYWTNSLDEWNIDISTDATLYYKTSDIPLADHMWGTYNDSDAYPWNNGLSFKDGDGYIKFWAVRKQGDQNEIVDYQALPYKYDTTIPDAFSVEKIKIDDKKFNIKSSSSIKDNLSSNLEVYYVLDNSELTEKSEIKTTGTRILLDKNNDEYGFTLHGESSMINHEVVFYVIDEAGNIQHTSVIIKDTSKPYLSVSGIDTDESRWSNTLNWLVTSIPTENVRIYFKTSDKNEHNWGKFESASKWDSEWNSENLADVISEKHHYVHFWAAYDNDSDHEVAEETFHYNFDKTKPTEFSVNMSDPFWPQSGNIWWSQRNFTIDAPFFESGSGIESVTYKIGEYGEQYVAFNESNGGYVFTTNINNDEYLANNTITFIVRDKAKNEQTFVIEDIQSSKPVIKKASVVCADKIEDLEKATFKPSLSFGDDKSKKFTYSNAIYANDRDYIKLEIDDSSLNSIAICVNGKDQSFGVRDQHEAERNGIIVYSDKSNYSLKNCYIPVNKLSGLVNHKVNTISFSVKNHRNTVSDKIYLLDSEENHCDIFYDPENQEDSTVFFSDTPQFVDAAGNKYYGGASFSEKIAITIKDDKGLKNYSYTVIGPNGNIVDEFISSDLSSGVTTSETIETEVEKVVDGKKVITTKSEDISYNIPVVTEEPKITIDRSKYKINGRYSIKVKVTDLAGNTNDENDGTYEFFIDNEAPTVKEDKYAYNPSLLKYFTFGIFGKDSVSLSVKVEDNELGCGISDDKVLLKLGEEEYRVNSTSSNGKTREFVFDTLPANVSGTAFFIIEDALGNKANYYLTIVDGVVSTNSASSTLLQLENIKPSVEIKLPENSQYNINGEIWYPFAFDYEVVASDKDSGLNNVSLNVKDPDNNTVYAQYSHTEDGVVVDDQTIKFASSDTTTQYIDEVRYNYSIDSEGHYLLIADSQDNAGNNASDDTEISLKTKREKIVHIDTKDPEITEFRFESKGENGSEIEYSTYGYYFKEDTIVRVYVRDEDVSSGINYVTLYRRESGKQETLSMTVYASGTENWNSQEGYAEFRIEKGFKGQIWAIVVDNVASTNYINDNYRHTSGFRFANGTIVEDAELHANVSSIKIEESSSVSASNVYRENDTDMVFYNQDVPLIITVEDSFSGISEIEWSIAQDNKQGTIMVNESGDIQITGSEAVVIDESIKKDSNLVTSLQFMVTVTSDTNDNLVSVNLTDNAKNKAEAATTKSYNIDKTAPGISSALTSNAAYYNGDQVVTITIDERNFRSNDVHFSVNGDEVEVTSWENDQDNANVHRGKYTISKDGVYSYNISYTDMAGNHAQNGSNATFVVDQTPPVLTTNFNEFKTSNNEHYFGVDQIDKNIVITITEHNFDPTLANIEIKRKDSGESHDKIGMEAVSRGTWSIDQDDKDKHIFTIPFSNKNADGKYDTYDGIYVISVTPFDLASNPAPAQESVIFEIDFTNPVISQRNGVFVSDTDKSYTNLEIFNDNTGVDDGFIPSVAMTDKNLDRIEYVLTVYTPEYTNGKEIGTITPSTYKNAVIKQIVDTGNDSYKTKEAVFALPEFKKDGIYSFDLTAVDKAGNKSVLCRNTSVLMMNSDVLAYITESKKSDNIKDSTGWYSLQKDEKTPISKRPDDFKDLKITVFAPTDSKTNIVLRDQNGKTVDTGLTADDSEDMYAVGVYNYTLPGQFFVDNYPIGTNKDIYLRTENTYKGETSNISLAWIRIDALAPSCKEPSDLKKGKAFIKNSKTYTITDISESLNPDECKVYDNGLLMTNFTYSESDKSLSYTLGKGRHNLSFVLVDEAGNSYTVKEVSFIQVGLFYCLWFRILLGIIIAALIWGCIWLFKKNRSHT